MINKFNEAYDEFNPMVADCHGCYSIDEQTAAVVRKALEQAIKPMFIVKADVCREINLSKVKAGEVIEYKPPPTEWMPIDTAPKKKGQYIVKYKWCRHGWCRTKLGIAEYSTYWEDVEFDDGGHSEEVLFWMPIPTPPEAGE